MLGIYQQLHDIEDQARGADLAGRRALRQTEGVAVWTRLCGVLESPQAKRLAPKDKLGEAVEYIRKHLAALRVYLDDPLVPIDNNDVEQLMKQVAVGRKNWLFVGSVEAGEQAAMLMTLTRSALRNDLHVETYIKAVLDTLLAGSTDYDALAPEAWAKTHPEAIREYRQTEREERQEAKTHRRERRRNTEGDAIQKRSSRANNCAPKTHSVNRQRLEDQQMGLRAVAVISGARVWAASNEFPRAIQPDHVGV